MEDAFRIFYGKEVFIHYKRTWIQEAPMGEETQRASFSGLSGILENTSKDFIFLKDVTHRPVRFPIKDDAKVPYFAVAKDLIGGISLFGE